MKNRLTIALLTSHLTNPLSKDIQQGIKENLGDNIDLITYTGGALGDKKHIEWMDVSGNIIYELVDKKRFDGVIIYGGAIGQYISKDDFITFCKKFDPVPVVNVSLNAQGIPSVMFSNFDGVYDLVTHMVKEHNAKRISFIKGPEGHDEAEERFRGYLEALEDNKIDFDPNLVSEGSFSVYSGKMGVKTFLDDRKLNIDAIVCVDDDTALGAMAEIKERGLNVPQDIAVVGFDDVDLAISTIPTLTTVKQPFKQLGKEAIKLLLNIISNKAKDLNVKVPSVPVIRDSCGCYEDVFFEENLLWDHKTIWEQEGLDVIKVIYNEFSKDLILNKEVINDLLDSINLYFITHNPQKLFMSFNTLLSRQKSIIDNQKKINSLIISLITHLGKKKHISKDSILLIIEQLRVKLYIGTYRERLLNNIQVEARYFDINNINQMLHNNATFNGLYKDTFKFFNSIEIKACYIVLFEKLNRLKEYSKLTFAFKDNEMFDVGDGITFESKKLLPDRFFNIEKKNMIVTALSSNSETMGYMILDMGEVASDISHALGWYYSSIFKRNYLLEEKNQKTIALENALEELKKTQKKLIESEKLASLGSLVAGVAHEINTPLGTAITYGTFIEDQVRELKEIFNKGELTKSFLEERIDSLSKASKGIYGSLRKTSILVKSFKDVANYEVDEVDEFKLADVIYSTIDSIKNNLRMGNHLVSVDCPGDIILNSYNASISNIFLGLFNNSLSHGFHNKKNGRIVVEARQEGDIVIIKFQDNGTGISKSDFKKVFEPFYTTKRGMGFIGLGLHTIHNIITQLLHGSIELTKCKKGTSIIIKLPTVSYTVESDI